MQKRPKIVLDLKGFHEVSDSPLFGVLQEKYYGQGQGDLWADSWVPMGVCSSVAMAEAYARTILAFARDCERTGQEPPVIVELGAGAGRLGWLILKQMEALAGYAGHDIPYIMTDGSQKLVDEWGNNPLLKNLIESNRMFTQRFWVGNDTKLYVGDEIIDLDVDRSRPVIFLANYLFDSLPCDLIRIKNGKLNRVLVRVNDGDDLTDLEITEDMFVDLSVEYQAVGVGGDYSGDARVNAIVEDYKQSGFDFCTSVSKAAVKFVQSLTAGVGPSVLLVGDIGQISIDEFSDDSPLILDSYFAYNINFDLIGRLFSQDGGVMITDTNAYSEFSTCAYLYAGKDQMPPEALSYPLQATIAQAEAALVRDNPANIEHLRDMVDAAENIDFTQLMMIIRLSKYDPDVALAVMEPLIKLIKQDPLNVDEGVIEAHMERALGNYFPISTNSQFDFMVAQLYLLCRLHEQAEALGERWIKRLGATPSRHYVLAMAKMRLNKRDACRVHLEKALKLDPDFGPARRALVDRFKANNDNTTAPELAYIADMDDPHFHKDAVTKLLDNGVLYVKNLYPLELIEKIKAQLRADHDGLIHANLGNMHPVGHKRRTIPLKIRGVYAESEVFAPPQLIEVIEEVMRAPPILNGYTSVVTYQGAKEQHVHRDYPALFDGSDAHFDLPPYGLTMLIPLMDLDENNGGTRFWPGTHKAPVPIDPDSPHDCVFTKAGDAVIFDMRTIHSGMACLNADEVRLMLCTIYSPDWFRDADSYNEHDALIIEQSEYAKLSKDHVKMFRFATKLPG